MQMKSIKGLKQDDVGTIKEEPISKELNPIEEDLQEEDMSSLLSTSEELQEMASKKRRGSKSPTSGESQTEKRIRLFGYACEKHRREHLRCPLTCLARRKPKVGSPDEDTSLPPEEEGN